MIHDSKISHFCLWFELTQSLKYDCVSLFTLGLDNNHVSFLPHFDDKGFAWEDVSSKPSINLLEKLWILFMEFFVNCLGCDSIETETVKDWHLEATHLWHFWVNMEWIFITIESIGESLVFLSCFFLNRVWGPLWNGRNVNLDCSFMTESTNSSNEKHCFKSEKQFTRFFVFCFSCHTHYGCLFLIL